MNRNLTSIAIVHFGESGKKLAAKTADALNGDRDGSSLTMLDLKGATRSGVERCFFSSDVIISVGSVSIAVRTFQKYFADKIYDPALISIDQEGRFVVAILGGHASSGNAWTTLLASKIKATEVITTTSDARKLPSLDTYCLYKGLKISPRKQYASVAAALNDARKVAVITDAATFSELKTIFPSLVPKQTSLKMPWVKVGHAKVSIGIGYRRGETQDNLRTAIAQVIESLELTQDRPILLSSVDLKKGDPAIRSVAKEFRLRTKFFPANQLAAIFKDQRYAFRLTAADIPGRRINTPGVAEPAAIAATSMGRLIMSRTIINGVVVAAAEERVL